MISNQAGRWIFGSTVVLMVLACGGSETSGIDLASSGPGSTLSTPAPIGAVYTFANVETVVEKAEFKNMVSKDEFFNHTASAGATLVVVDYKVKNVGKEDPGCLTSFADKIIDSTGTEYALSLECSMAVNSWSFEPLNPGLSKNFQACFEVPETAKGFTQHFSCGWSGEGYFALGI